MNRVYENAKYFEVVPNSLFNRVRSVSALNQVYVVMESTTLSYLRTSSNFAWHLRRKLESPRRNISFVTQTNSLFAKTAAGRGGRFFAFRFAVVVRFPGTTVLLSRKESDFCEVPRTARSFFCQKIM